jgi:site-specific DNA-methyltransferase (adenine-specific)
MKILVENSSKENEIVLDPFMGAGSTALACKELNRQFIGFELDKHYHDIANKRISEKMAQIKLF